MFYFIFLKGWVVFLMVSLGNYRVTRSKENDLKKTAYSRHNYLPIPVSLIFKKFVSRTSSNNMYLHVKEHYIE